MKRKEKVVLLGDGAVGKTSLVRRFVVDEFSDDYVSTIGSKITKKIVEVNGNELTFMLWDVLGQQGYTRVQAGSLYGATGAMLVVDLTRQETIGSIVSYWLPKLREASGDVPVVILANKADLDTDRQLVEVFLPQIAQNNDAPLILTSAKNGDNVMIGFTTLGEQILLRLERPKARPVPDCREGPVASMVEVADFIMNDFCHNFGDRQYAMTIIRQQFMLSGVDVQYPCAESLNRLVAMLANVEAQYLGPEWAGKMMARRLRVLAAVS